MRKHIVVCTNENFVCVYGEGERENEEGSKALYMNMG